MILTHDDDDDVCMYARYCSPQVFEFIAHDEWCCKPDEIDRDVRHGQVTQDHDDDVCMYACV